eukprot:scaffold53634_cov36-Phaeocystis_antarctica.AAC.1
MDHTWARGGARNLLQTSSPPLSPGRRGGATAQSALGWYRPSVRHEAQDCAHRRVCEASVRRH